MKIKDLINSTYNFWKEDFTKFLIVSFETYLINAVGMFLIFPFVLILDLLIIYEKPPLIPDIFVKNIIGDISNNIRIPIIIIAIPLIIVLFSLTYGISIPGLTNGIYRILNRENVKFGDVFKFGKKNIGKYFSFSIVNTLILFIIIPIIFIILIVISIIPIALIPQIEICFSIIMAIIIIFIVMILIFFHMTLPYVIKVKEDWSYYKCIVKTYQVIIKNLVFCFNYGLSVSVILCISIFIPVLPMILSFFFLPFFLTTLIIFYEMIENKYLYQRKRISYRGRDPYYNRRKINRDHRRPFRETRIRRF